MRVSFNPGNPRDVKRFFSIDVGFLDVLITRHQLFIIANKPEVYTHMEFEISSREDFLEETCFRIDRHIFLDMLTEGIVTFYVDGGDDIEVTFKTEGGHSYKLIRPHQLSDMVSILAKQEILTKRSKFNYIQLRKLEEHMKLMRNFSPIISVLDKKLVASEPHIELFIDVDCENVSLYTPLVKYLLEFAETIYGYQRYVIGVSANTATIAQSVVANANTDYTFVESAGSSHVFVCDMSSVIALANVCGEASSVIIDFYKESAVIVGKIGRFSTKFGISSKMESPSVLREATDPLDSLDLFSASTAVAAPTAKVSLKSLEIPIKVFESLLPASNKQIEVKIKRKVIQFNIGKGASIVVRRRHSNV
jgi:hypothetical protein